MQNTQQVKACHYYIIFLRGHVYFLDEKCVLSATQNIIQNSGKHIPTIKNFFETVEVIFSILVCLFSHY